MFEVIREPGVPSSQLPFSPAVKTGNFVFVSGQASVDEQGNIVADTLAGEIRRSFDNVQKILVAAGLSMKHVVKVCAYVARQEDLQEYNQIYKEFFAPPYPARTTLIGCLGKLLKFEVDVIAITDEQNALDVSKN